MASKKKAAVELLARLDKLRDVDRNRELCDCMSSCLLWAFVWEGRAMAEASAHKANVLGPEKLQELDAAIGAKRAELAEAQQQEAAAIAAHNSVEEDSRAIMEEMEAIKAQCVERNQHRRRLQMEAQQMQSEVESLQQQKETYEKALEEDTTEKAAEQREALALAQAQ
eukprot:354316-Chlamydomonas_euryale.AAC.12